MPFRGRKEGRRSTTSTTSLRREEEEAAPFPSSPPPNRTLDGEEEDSGCMERKERGRWILNNNWSHVRRRRRRRRCPTEEGMGEGVCVVAGRRRVGGKGALLPLRRGVPGIPKTRIRRLRRNLFPDVIMGSRGRKKGRRRKTGVDTLQVRAATTTTGAPVTEFEKRCRN